MNDLEKYKLNGTRGVEIVSLDEFIEAIIDCNTRNYNMSEIQDLNEYWAISNTLPKRKYIDGHHYTLLLSKKQCTLDDIIFNIIYQMQENYKEKIKKIFENVKEIFNIEND